MKGTRTKATRSGCSGCGGFIFLCLAIFAIVGWPIYLETHGASAPGVLTEKLENVRIEFTEWYRRFQVIATYSVPGQPVQHRAICDVDEKTYDSLHPGNTVEVRYFASLLSQPFLPATRLSPCSTTASLNLNAPVVRSLIVAFVGLLVILFLWRVLRIRIAVWLLLPWLCWCFARLALPRTEPEPQQPVAATAIVHSVVTVTTLGAEEDSIPLTHPYQMVVLQFVPPGLDSAVKAVDKVDMGSVPNLKEGQSVEILYDAAHPRIARLRQGTRLFPGHTMALVVGCCIASVVILAMAWVAGRVFGLMRR
jgi:hypothetical protein